MFHPTSILVPLDGSPIAEQALPIATELARTTGATLHLVTVHLQTNAWDPGMEFSIFSPDLDKQIRIQEEQYLDKLQQQLSAHRQLMVERQVIDGVTVDALVAHIQHTATSMVVMTSHGRGGLGRLLLGNVADSLIRQVGIPVLVVRPRKEARPAGTRNRILVPLDGSALSESVMDQAKLVARRLGLDMMLTTIVQPMPHIAPIFTWPIEAMLSSELDRKGQAQQHLEAWKVALERDGFRVQVQAQVGRKVARAILDLAEAEGCSMIAMSTHGAGGIDRMMFGSVTEQVLRHAEVPVLVLKPPFKEEESAPSRSLEHAAPVLSRPARPSAWTGKH
jgi:nucleotide-binding universal stress UspA family protein